MEKETQLRIEGWADHKEYIRVNDQVAQYLQWSETQMQIHNHGRIDMKQHLLERRNFMIKGNDVVRSSLSLVSKGYEKYGEITDLTNLHQQTNQLSQNLKVLEELILSK